MNEAIVKQLGPATTVRFYRWVLLIVPLLLLVGVYFASGLIERGVLRGLVALSLVFFVFLLDFVWKARSAGTGTDVAIRAIKKTYAQDLLPAFICSNDGEIVWQNERALERSIKAKLVAEFFKPYLPNSASVVSRITRETLAQGCFEEKLGGISADVEIYVQQHAQQQLWRCNIIKHATVAEPPESAMLTVGKKGTVLFINQAARTLIGERVKSLDRVFFTNVPLDGQVQTLQTTRGTIKASVEVQRLQGDRSQIFVTPVADEQRTQTKALKDLPIPLLFIDEQGLINEANTAALTLLGYSNLSDKAVPDVFDSHGVMISDWISAACNDNSVVNAEFLCVRGATKETFVQVALKQMEHSSKSCLVAVLTDATKLKSLEAQFVQSQKMQAIGQLAGGVVHDFNNLSTAISGHCDLMLLRHDAGDQDYADLMQIHQNTNRAAGLVSQLLALSRKQTLQLEQLDLRNTLSDLTHLLNRLVGETVTLTLTHDPVLRAVRADKRQLEQVIINFLVNARDAMPQGGEIKIQTEDQTLTEPLKRDRVTVPAINYIVVRVSDEGVGIDEDALQKIFEPFYTTKRVGEGTGLGLSTAYVIVKQTGGFILRIAKSSKAPVFPFFFQRAKVLLACSENRQSMLARKRLSNAAASFC